MKSPIFTTLRRQSCMLNQGNNYSVGVQRTLSFAGVRGVPEKLLFFFLAAVGGIKINE